MQESHKTWFASGFAHLQLTKTIMEEEEKVETVEEISTEEATDDVDYKSLYEEKQKEADKYKGYFKNAKAKEKKQPASQSVDVQELVQQELRKERELSSFKTKLWMQDIPEEMVNLKESNPNLSRDQVYKLSPQGNDPTNNVDPNEMSSPWRTVVVWNKAKITAEELSKLSQGEYNEMSDKIKKGEVTYIW